MFRTLELKNFRGFADATITGLRRINVVTGLNGAGKSSILEAAFLTAGAANASLVSSLYGFRGDSFYNPGVDRPFRSIFRDLDPEVVPQLIASTSDLMRTSKKYRRDLQIKPKYSLAQGHSTTAQSRRLSGVTFEFSGPSGIRRSSWGWADDVEKLVAQQNPPTTPTMLLGGDRTENPDLVIAQFVSPYVRDASITDQEQLTRLITERRLDEVVNALKLVNPNLKALHPLTEESRPVIYGDVGGSSLLPLSLLGSGLANCLHIILPAVLLENSMILVDEFEDGIHHSLIAPLLTAFLSQVRKRRNQVFITSHSNEFLRHLIAVANSTEDDDIAFFRLSRLGMNGQIPRYTLKEAQKVLESELDLR